MGKEEEEWDSKMLFWVVSTKGAREAFSGARCSLGMWQFTHVFGLLSPRLHDKPAAAGV